jgi:hypothetical protein
MNPTLLHDLWVTVDGTKVGFRWALMLDP